MSALQTSHPPPEDVPKTRKGELSAGAMRRGLVARVGTRENKGTSDGFRRNHARWTGRALRPPSVSSLTAWRAKSVWRYAKLFSAHTLASAVANHRRRRRRYWTIGRRFTRCSVAVAKSIMATTDHLRLDKCQQSLLR